MGFFDRLQHAWNAFSGSTYSKPDIGPETSFISSYSRVNRFADKTICNSVYNKIASDIAALKFEHAKIDASGRYIDHIESGLNYCLTVSANIDQTGRDFIQDIVMTMLDSGTAAVVPVKANVSPTMSNSYEIFEMRVGTVTGWFPEHVRVNLYNEKTGQRDDFIFPKKMVAIIVNPFYRVMNEPNGTMQRLIHKLNMLDAVDEQSSSGKLDLIIQLPYVIKSEARKQQAENRRKEIEDQLSGSKYGIAYTDGTEHITQLNRSLENNLLAQVQYLTSMFYNQLGMPESVFDGTADEHTMLNYTSRTVEPIASAIVNEMKRKFLTKTARTQGQSILFFSNPFKLVPVSQIADLADKLTRNEILSSNEIRQLIGFKPVDDPKADELRNKNINQPEGAVAASTEAGNYDQEAVDPVTDPATYGLRGE